MASVADEQLTRGQALVESSRGQITSAALAERLGSLTSLISSLPRELADRKEYLERNRTARLELGNAIAELGAWLRDASKLIKGPNEQINLPNITVHLQVYLLYIYNIYGYKNYNN